MSTRSNVHTGGVNREPTTLSAFSGPVPMPNPRIYFTGTYGQVWRVAWEYEHDHRVPDQWWWRR